MRPRRSEQTGDEQKEREFSYPKPRATLTWQATEADQVRTSITRDVAQLDFVEFASAINVVDASSLIGNPNLEPEKAWKARLEWEHKLGPRAAVTMAVFHDQVEDVQDFIPGRSACQPRQPSIAPAERSGRSMRRAISATERGRGSSCAARCRWRRCCRMPRCGSPACIQETDVTDPVTGAARRFSNERDWTYNASFRHDLPDLKRSALGRKHNGAVGPA